MLAGELPFAAGSVTELMQKHVSERAPALSSRVNGLPEGVEAFVDSLLEKEPGKRPASADVARVTIGRLLKRIASDSTAVRTVMPPPVPTLKIDRAVAPVSAAMNTDQSLQQAFPKKQRALWPVAVVLLLLGGMGAVVLRSGDEKPRVVVEAPKAVVEPAPVVLPVPVEVVKVAEPEAVKPPVVDDELAPIGSVKKKDPDFECEADAAWKKKIRLELQEYDQDGSNIDEFKPTLLKYKEAKSHQSCVEVETAFRAARKKLHRQ
jgi:hypothetical protein